MSDEPEAVGTVSRRDVVKAGSAAATGAAFAMTFGRSRPAAATGTDPIRVGVIGCGGRGTGAAGNAVLAGPNVKVVAMADAFQDRLDEGLRRLSAKEGVGDKIDVPPDRRFVGLDAYRTLLATDVNYVIVASPPGFKPEQIEATIAAGKHLFTEKPMAVDAPGIRTCFEVAEEARRKNLAIGVGLQRRHQRGYLEVMKRVHSGAIGDIVAARCTWLTGSLWVKPRQAHWSDLEWQMRNWLYFTWLSGDHIVEQHIHNLDVVSWGIGKHPIAAVATGGRQQRTDPAYGHVYDHFAVDFEYPGDVHLLSMCRQSPNCHNGVSEHLVGTRGRADTDNKTVQRITTTGKPGKTWAHDAAKDTDPYLQEHIDLIGSIRQGKPLNELAGAAESNLAAIMGRMAAYTGKRVTWEQALGSKETLLAADLKWGQMPVPAVAIPGVAEVI